MTPNDGPPEDYVQHVLISGDDQQGRAATGAWLVAVSVVRGGLSSSADALTCFVSLEFILVGMLNRQQHNGNERRLPCRRSWFLVATTGTARRRPTKRLAALVPECSCQCSRRCSSTDLVGSHARPESWGVR